MRFLLDTNAVIAFVEKRSAQLVNRVLSSARGDIGLPAVVIHELAFGAFRSRKVKFNLSTLHQLMRDLVVVDFTAMDAIDAGDIRADLCRKGSPIGPYDSLIAAQARIRKVCLVTNNTREFQRIVGLRIEDWTM